MAASVTSLPFIPFHEYDRIERTTPGKLEYLHGVTYVVAGEGPIHNMLMVRCAGLLDRGMEGGSFFVLGSKQHIVSPNQEVDFMPDVTVVQAGALDQLPYRLPNPFLVVEILSPETRAHDLGCKLSEYQKIPSLREILYVDSKSTTVRHWQRMGTSAWSSEPNYYQDASSELVLGIGATLRLAVLYKGTGLL